MKKALRERFLVEPKNFGGAKNFRPAADPLPGGAGRPKFNQLEMVSRLYLGIWYRRKES